MKPHDDARLSPLQRLYREFDSRFERVRRAYTLALSSLLAHRRGFAWGSWRSRALVRALPVPRPRFLPERRRGTDSPAHARADRHAHRGDGAPRRRSRSRDSQHHSAGGTRDDPRQPRRAEQRHQPVVQQRRDDRHARRRDPAVAAAGPSADRRIRHRAPRRAAAALPRRGVLLPACGHHHADPQLRPACGHRREGHAATTCTRTPHWRRKWRKRSARFPAPWTRTCTSASTARRWTWRWTGRAFSSSASRRATSGRTC